MGGKVADEVFGEETGRSCQVSVLRSARFSEQAGQGHPRAQPPVGILAFVSKHAAHFGGQLVNVAVLDQYLTDDQEISRLIAEKRAEQFVRLSAVHGQERQAHSCFRSLVGGFAFDRVAKDRDCPVTIRSDVRERLLNVFRLGGFQQMDERARSLAAEPLVRDEADERDESRRRSQSCAVIQARDTEHSFFGRAAASRASEEQHDQPLPARREIAPRSPSGPFGRALEKADCGSTGNRLVVFLAQPLSKRRNEVVMCEVKIPVSAMAGRVEVAGVAHVRVGGRDQAQLGAEDRQQGVEVAGPARVARSLEQF